MLELRGLTVRYGVETALDSVSERFCPRTAYAIVGPSGCGKTSLLYAMAGLLPPNAGSVTVAGAPLAGPRGGTGLVTQKNTLLPWKTIVDNVALGLVVRGIPHAEASARALGCLAELGIAEHARKLPGQLSGGQAQRAALARTLVTVPDILLMDEPTSQLDQMTKEDVQDVVLAQYVKHPSLRILVTHSVEEAVFLGERILVMERGRFTERFGNPGFGRSDARDRDDFYALVMEIRKALQRMKP